MMVPVVALLAGSFAGQLSPPAEAAAPPAAPAVAPATPAVAADAEAPIIEDIAAAASNPDAQPVITVMMSDPGSGVGKAQVHFRARPALKNAPPMPWGSAELVGGDSGLFIARLPDGLQRTGFDYYVEALDQAGNGPARIGSPDAPIQVARATRSTAERLAENRAAPEVSAHVGIHPAWLMLSLGVGVLAGAGAGAYAIDLNGVNNNIADTNELIASNTITEDQRAALVRRRQALEQAATQDTVMASVLGVVGAAGLITGTVLVVVTSLE